MGDYVLDVNGGPLHVSAPADESLLSVLRNRLNLTGTKYGCGEGQCGACTVLLNGVAARSCLTPVGTAAKAKIETIEGLEPHGVLTPVQQAFLDEEALRALNESDLSELNQATAGFKSNLAGIDGGEKVRANQRK